MEALPTVLQSDAPSEAAEPEQRAEAVEADAPVDAAAAGEAAGGAEVAGDAIPDDERWAALVARTEAVGARFVYAVTTTRIYCRPGCPSRTPLRAHVRFYRTAARAEAAGFRACKRCGPAERPARSAKTLAVERACRLIDAGDDFPSLDELASAAGLSRFHFHRVFRGVLGITPRAYAVARRRERLRDALPTSRSVTEAAYRAGFASNAPFYTAATAELGMEPSRYRAEGAGTTIRFAVGASSLGTILIAATERGICAIDLGEDAQRLVDALKRRFSRATFVDADEGFKRLVAVVTRLVEAPSGEDARDVPLDARGTAFQQRVWQALRRIPCGSTATYRDIARAIGASNGARAVAAACAANPIAVIVPCHRVVRTDGDLRGYRWGIRRKRELLSREKTPKKSPA